jgi:hypothetical protein
VSRSGNTDIHRFERNVEQRIQGLAQSARSFEELLSALPGVYLPVAARALDRLAASNQITPDQHRICTGRLPRPRSRRSARQRLPPPHPLDYDWRFAPDAIDALLQLIARRSTPGETVAMIGTPSLYLAAHDRHLDRRLVLIDANPTTVERLRDLGLGHGVLRRDVFTSELPDLGAAVVIADPPWYVEHVDAFLWAAAHCATKGAALFMSLPAVGTRPGIRNERSLLRATAKGQGLSVARISAGSMPYVSPPFEVNALKAAGWTGLPTEWRRGDLAEFHYDGAIGTRSAPPPRAPQWDERLLGTARIRIRRRTSTAIDPRLISLFRGHVLDDVSRRHPIREQVGVWTSGNRIYGCGSPGIFLKLLEAVGAGCDPVQAVADTIKRDLNRPEEAKIASAVAQIHRLSRIEGRELRRLGWEHSPTSTPGSTP